MRQVELLLAMQEHQTLRDAAERVGITQSAASQMIQELEDAVDEQLFDRERRGLRLNASGRAMLNSFRVFASNMNALTHELAEIKAGSAGRLLVGCILQATPHPICEVLVKLRKIYPLLSVEVLVDSSDRLVECLRAGTVDVVIGRMPEDSPHSNSECDYRLIADESIAVVVAPKHPLIEKSGKQRIRFPSLTAYPWILQTRGSPMREMIELEAKYHHQSLPQGLVETTSIVVTAGLLEYDNMIGFVSQAIATDYEKKGFLRILPYRFKHRLTSWGSLVRRDRPIGKISQSFLDILHGNNGDC